VGEAGIRAEEESAMAINPEPCKMSVEEYFKAACGVQKPGYSSDVRGNL
jgi:hypothetical protein